MEAQRRLDGQEIERDRAIGKSIQTSKKAEPKDSHVLLAYEFEEVPLGNDYAPEVLEHMREVNCVTFYDAASHVLALRMKGLYLTADHAYVKKAK